MTDAPLRVEEDVRINQTEYVHSILESRQEASSSEEALLGKHIVNTDTDGR